MAIVVDSDEAAARVRHAIAAAEAAAAEFGLPPLTVVDRRRTAQPGARVPPGFE
jgi:hypothetical protein